MAALQAIMILVREEIPASEDFNDHESVLLVECHVAAPFEFRTAMKCVWSLRDHVSRGGCCSGVRSQFITGHYFDTRARGRTIGVQSSGALNVRLPLFVGASKRSVESKVRTEG